MFVLLFGLMGVAAIFPVGNHYVVEGEKYDLGASIAQNAFEELKARGMLKPEVWLYPTDFGFFPAVPFIDTDIGPTKGRFKYRNYNPGSSTEGPGNVIVIDPLGGGIVASSLPEAFRKMYVPYAVRNESDRNPWQNGQNGYGGATLLVDDSFGVPYSPQEWPVRRVTFQPGFQALPPGPSPPEPPPVVMTGAVAETIFRLRDDLAVDQPEQSDRPSIQRWDTSGTALLRRQYKGNYSWLATIVPPTAEAHAALQPEHPAYGQYDYDVSVVVFRKREETPSDTSERLINAELLLGGELVIYSTTGTQAQQEVDAAVDGIKAGNWIALTGVNQTTGDFIMKWYRILALDDETSLIRVESEGGDYQGRRAMLLGPDWPAPAGAIVGGAIGDLRAVILPEVMSVVTKPLKMESSSLWQLD
jgi:hypothetical protein